MLVIDLLGVSFAGSAALGLFVTLQKFVRQRGGQILFCNVDPMVFEVFRISKLDFLFLFVADRPEALALAERLDTPKDENGANATGPADPPPSAPGQSRNSGNDGLLRRHRRRKL